MGFFFLKIGLLINIDCLRDFWKLEGIFMVFSPKREKYKQNPKIKQQNEGEPSDWESTKFSFSLREHSKSSV